jgi:hypothetical protein
MRPTLEQVFGFGTQYTDGTTAPGLPGIFIPESALVPEGGLQGAPDVDAQKLFLIICQKAGVTLNEANRNNNAQDIRVTFTYGSWDAIIDPPGSETVYRRDVFSLIAYQTIAYTQFDPNDV